MTARVVKITDGTDTVDFEDSSSGYTILRHRPAVAEMMVDGLDELYSQVDEQFEIAVEGSTPTELSERLAKLSRLIDNARGHYQGEGLDPVLYQYRIDDSLLTNPLQAMIIGGPESGDVLTLPESYDGFTQTKTGDVGDPVVWRFRRQGLLLGDSESNTGSSVANPNVMTALLTAVENDSPTDIELDNFTTGPESTSFLAIADDANKLYVNSLATMTAVGFTAANDAAALPKQGTNILRYTPPDTDWNETGTFGIGSVLRTDTREIAIFIDAKKSNAALNALVKAKLDPLVSGMSPATIAVTTPQTSPKAITNTGRQWYALGTVHLPVPAGDTNGISLSFLVKCDTTSYTLDLDAFALVDADNSQVLYFPGIEESSSLNSNLYSQLNIIQRDLELPYVEVQIGTSVFLNLPYQGAPRIYTKGAEVAALWLSTSYSAGPGGSSFWCGVSAAGARLSTALSATRYPGYLVPR